MFTLPPMQVAMAVALAMDMLVDEPRNTPTSTCKHDRDCIEGRVNIQLNTITRINFSLSLPCSHFPFTLSSSPHFVVFTNKTPSFRLALELLSHAVIITRAIGT